MSALGDAIAEVNRRGLQVNNLFQVSGHWRANVTDGAQFWHFADGDTAAEALTKALVAAPVARKPQSDLEDLLG